MGSRIAKKDRKEEQRVKIHISKTYSTSAGTSVDGKGEKKHIHTKQTERPGVVLQQSSLAVSTLVSDSEA